MYQGKHLDTLRKSYKKNLLSYLGIAAIFLVVGGLMLVPQILEAYDSTSPDGSEGVTPLLPAFIVAALAVALILAAAENALHKALLRRGVKRARITLVQLVWLVAVVLVAITVTHIWSPSKIASVAFIVAYLFMNPLFPAIGLLRDGSKLRDGDLSETVGRMKPNSRHGVGSSDTETHILFEDELTHEVHFLRISNISPNHRYRVFFLPHSGLAVGEAIPDNITFEPFGNPMEREVENTEPFTEKPAYTEESYTVKPDYNEDAPAEKPWYQNPESFSSEPPKKQPAPSVVNLDPNSPERVRAAKFRIASKVCKVLTFVFFGGIFLGAMMAKNDISPGAMLLTIPFFVGSIILSEVFKNKELKIRCTKRTTAFCVDTVRRRSGKHTVRHPIVQYEVKGVTMTAELSISCSRDAAGDLYTIYYDPLDPSTVRAERRGLFE